MTIVTADTFHRWAEAADAVGATRSRLQKGVLLKEYLAALDDEALPLAARFFAGVVFARHDARTTNVGPSIIFDMFGTVTGASASLLHERYVVHGDAGELAGELFSGREPSGVTLADVARFCAELATARGTNARRALVRDAFGRLGALEARYLVKLLGGELRIGLKEAQVEEALAAAFGRPLAAVRRANLLRGDIGEVALSAKRATLDEAELALFHPIGFMLAQPLATAAEVASALPAPFVVEDKYDGIRAQAHVSAERVVLFSRTLDDITRGYPEVVAALRDLGPAGRGRGIGGPRIHFADRRPSRGEAERRRNPIDALVLDGELLAYDPAAPERARPFKALQQRLGRKQPSAELIAAVPVTYVVYDMLASGGALVIDEPQRERRHRLEALTWPAPAARLAPSQLVAMTEDVEAAFIAARTAGNEGIVAKDPDSPYTPGRRGKAWIKLKRPLATLDVVVTAVERGHGRRRGVLSDYTFAVRTSESDPTLLDVGKAYNGLTDAEIAALTPRFEALTLERFAGYHRVKPEIVLEVTFDVVQPSARHAAGYALRFPRILRVRDDKPPVEIDTLARVRELAGE